MEIVFALCGLVIAVAAVGAVVVSLNVYFKELIMSASQDAVDAVVAQLAKAKDEIVARVADLEAQVAAGEAPDLSALKAAAQSLDDVVVDVAPEPAPVEEV